jgi:UDP-sugar pyrophosphorylase
MTSEENHAVTMAFLEENNFFGMDKDQIIVRQQPLVPAVMNSNADFALDADDPYRLQGKPHGHGDVHMLLHHSGVVKQWEREGRSHIVFIQDTNGQVFNGLLAAVGVSMEKDLDVNFLTVDREAGEKTGKVFP